MAKNTVEEDKIILMALLIKKGFISPYTTIAQLDALAGYIVNVARKSEEQPVLTAPLLFKLTKSLVHSEFNQGHRDSDTVTSDDITAMANALKFNVFYVPCIVEHDAMVLAGCLVS